MKSLPALVASCIRFCNLLLSFCPTLPYQPQLLLIPRHCTEILLDNDQPYCCVAITPERQTYLALPVALLDTSQDDLSQPRRAIGRQVLSFLRLLRFDFHNMYLNYVRDCLMYCFSIHSIRNMVASRHWFSMDSLDCQYYPSGSWTMDLRGRPSTPIMDSVAWLTLSLQLIHSGEARRLFCRITTYSLPQERSPCPVHMECSAQPRLV